MDSALSSMRCEARSQPCWTNISLPSGRISDSVTWKSVSGAVDVTYRSAEAEPSSTLSSVSAPVSKAAYVPSGGAVRPVPLHDLVPELVLAADL